MKLTILIDNNTFIDRYFLAEPGVSYLIEEENMQILFDTGYSGAFIGNAYKLNINLLNTDFIVLSHGHIDHTGGFDALIKLYNEASIASLSSKKAVVVSHPFVFQNRIVRGFIDGPNLFESRLSCFFDLNFSKKPIWLSDRLVFLGEIERLNNFEGEQNIGQIYHNKKNDYVADDSALVYKSDNGLVIITGCSHSGICNIIEYAKKACNEDRIIDIIGGFHLMNPSKKQLNGTLNYLKHLKVKNLHPCHCVDFNSKIALSKVANIDEVGVGLVLVY